MRNITQPISTNNPLNKMIPARLVLGVTGHRKLDHQPWLIGQVREAIAKASAFVPPLRNTPLEITILSPLAEGADRLVAQEVLAIQGSILEVILPLKKDDYKQDFESNESKDEFEQILSKARIVRILPPKDTRKEAYEQVGHYVVDQCDVLIALWNGKPAYGQGGTDKIVQYARDIKCPLIWVNTNDHNQIKVEPGHGVSTRPFQDLDKYNAERINANEMTKQEGKHRDFLKDRFEDAGLFSEPHQPIMEYAIPYQTRADILAQRYQRLHYRTETSVYVLSTLAVVTAAFQFLFFPERQWILTLEVALMLATLFIVAISLSRSWHRKWIDYRFLAERFRSALFMAIANTSVSELRPPQHLSLAYSPKDWMVSAFTSVWNKRPQFVDVSSLPLEKLKTFICTAWIDDQIQHHDWSSRRQHRRHYQMNIASYVMFGLTIVAASLHIAGVGSKFAEQIFMFAAIVLPTTATSITAIRTHREYLRNSMRSAEMARQLKELKQKIMLAQDNNTFIGLLKEAEETMLHENEDWRIVVRFHGPELPV